MSDLLDRSLTSCIIAFSERFHRALPDTHQIASPVGAWLLLALSATATQDDDREACAAVLGMDVDRAAGLAGRLLENVPAAVACAGALWIREQFDTAALRAWRSTFPAAVARGEMPAQAEADRWARDCTMGLIQRFPIVIEPLTAVVLASALAARSKWIEPYRGVPGAFLGRAHRARSPSSDETWSGRVQRALRSPERSYQRILRSTRAGDVAVHRMHTQTGLAVTSVIARRGIPRLDVLAAAHEVATQPSPNGLQAISLFDLPLGDDELWSIEEDKTPEPGRHEELLSCLPAWEAECDHDLLAMRLGLETVAAALNAMLPSPPPPLPPNARQAAVARYTLTGFEASAVSAMGLRVGASLFRPRLQGIKRVATLRFGHPFAVVAVVDGSSERTLGLGNSPGSELWQGLPVFSAWIAEPGEAQADELEELFLRREQSGS